MNLPAFREVIGRKLSIIICTRNRQAMLREALGSFKNCRQPAGWSVEIIVVDNGSTDGTMHTASSFDGKLPFPLKVVAEPRIGLGNARVTGLAASDGELVACTDDDCVVSENWCEAIVSAFQQEPALGILFGRVLPHAEAVSSVWRVAIKTNAERTIHRFPCWPIIGFGNNMAYRRSALESAGGFNLLFGAGCKFWSADELEVAYRVLRNGWLASYEPTVQLWHRARTEFNAWKLTHWRDAMGIGAFSGSYGIRGNAFAWKFFWWNWEGMAKSWLEGFISKDAQKRQVGGWYMGRLLLGLFAGMTYGIRKSPEPRDQNSLIIRAPTLRGEAIPLISVIVCTRNRAAVLKEALVRLQQSLSMRPGEYDIVIVDNGSHDGTHAVVEAACSNSPCAITYVYEPRAGLSRARNAGLAAAKGGLLAFTDDDCLVSPDWLRNAADAIQNEPELSGLCGRVLPYDEGASSSIVSVKTDTTPKRYRYPCSPFVGHGNNMAFRRQVLEEIGGFDLDLGPGAPMGAAEEFDVIYRVLRAGHTLAYEPQCVIQHRARTTEREASATEWRNAIGLGACLSKHFLSGDSFALKCAYWLVTALPSITLKTWRAGDWHNLKCRTYYCLGIPVGTIRWVGHSLGGRGRRRVG